MKIRKRLSPETAKRLGFEVKPKEGTRNARYYVDVDKLKRLQNKLKVLLFDIETSPMRSYTWSCWKQNIGTNQIISDWFILTWSAKWLFEDEVLSDKLTGEESLKENDERITKTLFDLIDEADVTISHNGDKFDIRRINTRFLIHGLGTPSSYINIDTLKHARKQFSISSNRLDYLGQFLGIGRKIDTGGFELWSRCMKGEDEALKEMQEYCDQDVKLLEDVYLTLRPYIKPHPNLGLYINDDIKRCPTCGSDKIRPIGDYYTTVSIYNV
jgi:DNA polymerase elongation subunit (family B)